MEAGAEKDEKMKTMVVEFHKFMAILAKLLPADKKFIHCDSTCIYDFQVAGFFCNLVLNESAKDKEMWAAEWEKAPERVKKYVADFQEDMKAYLDARPQGRTI
jgi:hypothetical protein